MPAQVYLWCASSRSASRVSRPAGKPAAKASCLAGANSLCVNGGMRIYQHIAEAHFGAATSCNAVHLAVVRPVRTEWSGPLLVGSLTAGGSPCLLAVTTEGQCSCAIRRWYASLTVGHLLGRFRQLKGDKATHNYVPDAAAGCTYHPYRHAQRP